MIWLDVRAAEEAGAIAETGDPANRHTKVTHHRRA